MKRKSASGAASATSEFRNWRDSDSIKESRWLPANSEFPNCLTPDSLCGLDRGDVLQAEFLNGLLTDFEFLNLAGDGRRETFDKLHILRALEVRQIGATDAEVRDFLKTEPFFT